MYVTIGPLSPVAASGVGGFEGSGRGGEFVISGCLAPTPTPLYTKISSDFDVSHGPTGQLRGVRTPGPPGQLRRCCRRQKNFSAEAQLIMTH